MCLDQHKKASGAKARSTTTPRQPDTAKAKRSRAWRGAGLKPLGKTGLTEERGFVVAPCFDGALGMPRNRSAAGALEIGLLGLTLGQELADQGQDNNACNDDSDDDFR